MSIDVDYNTFIQNIKSVTNIDLSLYKEGQMKRRLTALRDKLGYPTFASYFAAIMKNQQLMDELLDRMTINVTEFYRDPKRWDILQNSILPRLIKEKRKLKIWSAACSTGEEPYTIAMTLERLIGGSEYQILATDLDEIVLRKAQEGKYIEKALVNIPLQERQRYFKRIENLYTISEQLKQHIRFRKHNLLSDYYDTNYDLIVCRNVMIYFTDEAKTKIYRSFANALSPGGILFVGSTEQIFTPHIYGLETVKPFFYQKK